MKNSWWFFILISSFSFGQTKLSVTDAVVVALQNNFDIQVAQKQIDINEMNNKWSQAGAFPTVELNVSQNNTIQDNRNNPFTFTPGVILSQGVNPTLSANVNIFSGMRVIANKRRLETLELQSANNAMAVVETVIQDVMKAYFTAVLQKERMEVFESVMDLSREQYRYNETKNEYSASNSLDLMQSKNQYLTDSSNYLMQKMSYQNSIRNLKLLLNESDSSERINLNYELVDGLELGIKQVEFSNARKDMLANNQNLTNQYINLELQKHQTDLQKSFLYPVLSFQIGVQPGWQSFRELNSGMSQNTFNLAYYGNFNLRYTIFNNWQNKRAVTVSKIQEEIATLNIQKLTYQLDANLSNLLELYEQQSTLVGISQENINYSKKAYELAQSRYKSGTLNSIDLASFQNAYRNSMVVHYENLFNKLSTYVDIYKMTGKLGLDYVK